ncbi:luciferin 4-monooxygenase-like [Diorhabda sublineata]|uniref:luciferin 4-monooxygenase-like n=1 Tax=Diorhabda sublineata TaxID=1163346 RepID=UPI0024E0CA7A|nr:luciferin 4-monooxygenase-like [Diorhabda sublineata]
MEDDFVINGPPPTEPLQDRTLGQVFMKILLENEPDTKVMVDSNTGEILTSKQLLEESFKLAQALIQYGCSSNTTISIGSENNLQFFIPVMGSIFAGTIMAPLNCNYTEKELEHTLNITMPKIVFCSKALACKYLKLKNKLTFIEQIVVIDSNEEITGTKSINKFVSDILKGKTLSNHSLPFDGDPKESIAFILSSSGTTGLPKGVMLTHFNLVTRMLQSRYPDYLSHHSTVLGLMPFSLSYGLFFGLTSIFNRHLTVMMNKFTEDSFLKTIQDYKVSVVRLAPPLAIFLAKSSKVNDYNLSCIAEVFSAGAPLSGKTEETLKARLKIEAVHQAYGCTEGTLALTIMNKDQYRPGSCGKVITYMQCKVRDPDTGKSLGPNTVGELCFKGPTIMKGYCNNPDATKESFTEDGWLRTGDLGYYDDEQYFYIVDRLKELIKYNGYQVAPAELEAILVNHPKVFEAAVVGMPNEKSGELPLAFVVKEFGQHVTEKELQDYVAERVSHPKKLRGGVIFVKDIPKTQSGKIMRKQLRNKLKEYQKVVQSKL